MIRVRHVGIVVNDLECALKFYRDLLGLKVVKIMDESGPYLDQLLSLQESRVTTVKMSAGNDTTLVELLEFKSHRLESQSLRPLYAPGPSHVAFTVEDIDELYRRLSAAGIRFNGRPQTSPDGCARVAYCLDPSGTAIELVQIVKGETYCPE